MSTLVLDNDIDTNIYRAQVSSLRFVLFLERIVLWHISVSLSLARDRRHAVVWLF